MYPNEGAIVSVFQDGVLVDIAVVNSVTRTCESDMLEIESLEHAPGRKTTFVFSGHPYARGDGWRMLFPDPLADGITCISRQTYSFPANNKPH